jgi:O-antigen biosynthesis protein
MSADEVLQTRTRSARSLKAVAGSFLGLARLSTDHWFVVGRLPDLPGGPVKLRMAVSEQRLSGTWVPFAGDEDADPALGALIVEGAATRVNLTRGVAVQAGRKAVEVEPLSGLHSAVSLEALVDRHLTGLTAAARRDVLNAVAVLPANDSQASAALRVVRSRLRDSLPAATADPASPCPAHADVIWRLDEQAFYVEGWLHEGDATCESLVAISPEGLQVELVQTVFRFARADVAEFLGLPPVRRVGFVAYFETAMPNTVADGWLLEVRLSNGVAVEMALPPVKTDVDAARLTILGDLALERRGETAIRRGHVRPALERIQNTLAREVKLDSVDQFGEPVSAAEVSVIVPLYKRVDYLEHQLAQFVHDPEFQGVDLIYVLDSPEQGDYLRAFAAQLHRLYRLPFRLAVVDRNGGFSAANNLGAELAAGRKLLLLNSDILPAEPGWLSQLVHFHDVTPSVGAVAPKLLYEDGSIQHAGLYFDRPDGAEAWSNEHYYKGLYRTLASANAARIVPAVTGACLLIDTGLYRELGGLRGIYVQGDYEDSDLCLRLYERGLDCWYVPDVELYHLEGQSYPSVERRLSSEFNKWLHTEIWDSAIDQVMRRPEVT